MTIRIAAVWVATLVAAGAGGWLARGLGPDPTLAATAASVEPHLRTTAGSTRTSDTPSSASAPLIVVSGDGQATLRVEQQPLQWVIEQIALQARWPELAALTLPAGAPAAQGATAAATPDAACAAPGNLMLDTTRLLRALRHGDGQQRLEALRLARAQGVPVDADTLRSLYEVAGTGPLRLEAFQAHLEALEEQPGALRASLQAALNLPDAGIQQEAAHRLASLHLQEGLEVPAPPATR